MTRRLEGRAVVQDDLHAGAAARQVLDSGHEVGHLAQLVLRLAVGVVDHLSVHAQPAHDREVAALPGAGEVQGEFPASQGDVHGVRHGHGDAQVDREQVAGPGGEDGDGDVFADHGGHGLHHGAVAAGHGQQVRALRQRLLGARLRILLPRGGDELAGVVVGGQRVGDDLLALLRVTLAGRGVEDHIDAFLICGRRRRGFGVRVKGGLCHRTCTIPKNGTFNRAKLRRPAPARDVSSRATDCRKGP